MEESLVCLTVARVAKKKGFNELCFHHFGCDDELFGGRGKISSRNSQWVNCCTVPTQALLQKWLREVYDIDIFIIPKHKDLGKFYGGFIEANNILVKKSFGSNYDTFEKALDAGLLQALNLIPDKNV